jgi:hypothetical protein
MARLTIGEMFDNVRGYLDTDDLNFPNDLLDMLLQRLWFQAVTMEREWRFFQRQGSVEVTTGTKLVPFTFETLPTAAIPGVRLMVVQWERDPLVWRELSMALRQWGDSTGWPMVYSEQNDGPQRNIALFPTPSTDGTLYVEFWAEPVYPVVTPGDYNVYFADLPGEFDQALQEGLIAEMYMREEDPDLYDVHRNMFLEQMGSIRNRWKESLYSPIVMAGRARGPCESTTGFTDRGAFRQPAAP